MKSRKAVAVEGFESVCNTYDIVVSEGRNGKVSFPPSKELPFGLRQQRALVPVGKRLKRHKCHARIRNIRMKLRRPVRIKACALCSRNILQRTDELKEGCIMQAVLHTRAARPAHHTQPTHCVFEEIMLHRV